MTKTVLLTGITGFIAKRIAFDLLAAGYHVRGTLRDLSREDEVRAAVGPEGLDRLDFTELDLTRDEGWIEAIEGIDVLMHTASPFPMGAPKDEGDLIRPAVDGTLRAMRAAQAAGVVRVVLTASMASVSYSAKPDGYVYGPDDWTDITWPGATAYIKSKTLAERAARDFVTEHPEMQLTTIHPGLVTGTPMDAHFGTSLRLVKRMLSGRDPAQPDLPISVVDIDDVSRLHIAAMEQDETMGMRLIAAEAVLSFVEIAKTLAAAYPDHRIATRTAPKLLLRAIGLFDPAVRGIVPLVGKRLSVDASASLPYLPDGFVPARDSVLRSARYIADMAPG